MRLARDDARTLASAARVPRADGVRFTILSTSCGPRWGLGAVGEDQEDVLEAAGGDGVVKFLRFGRVPGAELEGPVSDGVALLRALRCTSTGTERDQVLQTENYYGRHSARLAVGPNTLSLRIRRRVTAIASA
jgi:hypothetical protein